MLVLLLAASAARDAAKVGSTFCCHDAGSPCDACAWQGGTWCDESAEACRSCNPIAHLCTSPKKAPAALPVACMLGVTTEHATARGFRVHVAEWRPDAVLTWNFGTPVKVERFWGKVRPITQEGEVISFALQRASASELALASKASAALGAGRRDPWGFALVSPHEGRVHVTCDGASPSGGASSASPAALPGPKPAPSGSLFGCSLGAAYYTNTDASGEITAMVRLQQWRPAARIVLHYDAASSRVHDVQRVTHAFLVSTRDQKFEFQTSPAESLAGELAGLEGDGGTPASTFSFRASGLQSGVPPHTITCPGYEPSPPPPPLPPPRPLSWPPLPWPYAFSPSFSCS